MKKKFFAPIEEYDYKGAGWLLVAATIVAVIANLFLVINPDLDRGLVISLTIFPVAVLLAVIIRKIGDKNRNNV